jgi:hypothetical protein
MTPARFAQGMTFDEYVRFAGTPENLAREGTTLGVPAPRKDWSGFLKDRHANAGLTATQVAAIRWLAAQPNGPAKVLVLSEDWSSDCRRDVPYLERLAEAGGLELRIFNRDGDRQPKDGRPDPALSPNADLMLAYLNEREGTAYASIPVAVFFDRDFNELYRYVEFPSIYRKDALVAKIRGPRPGETAAETAIRGRRDFSALFETPFYDVWAHAGIAEILAALHARQVIA